MDCTGVSGLPFLRNSAKHGLGAAKQGLGAAKHCIVMEKARKTLQMGWAKMFFLDCTGVSGSPFLQNSAKHGLGAAKQGLSAAKHRIVKEIA